MRVLHLIDPAAGSGGPCVLRLLAEAVSRPTAAQQDVLIIGTTAHAALARRCGLAPIGRLSAPLNRPILCRRALNRFLGAYESAFGPYDLIHVWTLSTAALTVLGGRSRRVLATLVTGPEEGAGLRFGPLSRVVRGGVSILAASEAVRAEYEAAGVGQTRRGRGELAVLPPAVNREAIASDLRPLLRQRWGADETTLVVGLLGEPASSADASLSVTAVSRVALTGKDVKLVLHHGAAGQRLACRMLDRLGMGDRIVVDDEVAEPWRVAAGLDAAFLITQGRGSVSILPALWAMAAGAPVIAEGTDAFSEFIDDERSGLLIAPGDANAAAERLLRLYDDARAAARIGAAGRALIETRFTPDVFAARLDDVYRQCHAGEPIRIAPDLPSAPHTVGSTARTDPSPDVEEEARTEGPTDGGETWVRTPSS